MPKPVIAAFAGNPPLRACEGVNAEVFRLRDSAVSAPSHRRHGLFPEAVWVLAREHYITARILPEPVSMIPYDGEGRAIYPRVYRVLKAHGGLLTQCGYVEAKKKPNLFYRNAPGCVFFADMRGTEDVKIWEDTRPLHSVLFSKSLPKWQMRRIRKQELEMLFESGCLCRLSFYFPHSESEFEETGVFLDQESGLFLWPDGYCRYCGKDFRDEGWYCTTECERADDFASLPACAACGVKVPRQQQIRHHVSYNPEKVVIVHASCHQRIHRTSEHPELQPSAEDIREYYRRVRATVSSNSGGDGPPIIL